MQYPDLKEIKGYQVAIREDWEGHESYLDHGPDDIPVPPDLSYFPYQRGGIAYARSRDGVLIADEMGLGKTIQAIGIMNDTKPQTALIVCPASLKGNWEREVDKWLNYYRSVHVQEKGRWNDKAHIVIINYDILKKHKAEINAREWDILICDEAHYLKNEKALRTCLVLGGEYRYKPVAPIRAKKQVFLTGTPIENRPIELWPIVNYLRPDIFDDYHRFAFSFCNASFGRFGIETYGASQLKKLNTLLRENLMVRRMKAQVLKDLPDKIRRNVYIDLTKEGHAAVDKEMAAFALMKKSIKQKVKAAVTKEEIAEAAKSQELMKGEIAKARKSVGLHKVEPSARFIKNQAEAGGKIIVFGLPQANPRQVEKRDRLTKCHHHGGSR